MRQRARLSSLHLKGEEQLGKEDWDEEEQEQAHSCKKQLQLPSELEVYPLDRSGKMPIQSKLLEALTLACCAK